MKRNMDFSDLSTHKRYFSLICAFLLQCFLGANNFWGFINPYICSYYYNKGDLTLTPAETSQANNLRHIFYDFGLILSTFLCEYLGFRALSIIGALLYGFSFVVISWTSSFQAFFFTYSVLNGICQGIFYIQPTFAVMTSFPNRKGLVTSTIATGSVFASIIAGNLAQYLVNPHNEKPTQPVEINGKTMNYFGPEITENLPTFFLVLGLLSMVFGTVLGFGILTGSQFKGKIQLYIEEKMEEAETQSNFSIISIKQDSRITTGHVIEVSKSVLTLEKNDRIMNESILAFQSQSEKSKFQIFKEVLTSREFYILFACKFLTTMPGSQESLMFKTFGLSRGLSDSFLTNCGTAGLVTTIFVKFIIAFFLDEYGFKRAWQGLLIVSMLSMAGLVSLSYYEVGFLIMNSLAISTVGGTLAIYTATSQIVYGRKKGPLVFSFLSLSTIVGTLTHSSILYLQEKLGYDWILVIMFGIGAFAYFIMSFAREKRYS